MQKTTIPLSIARPDIAAEWHPSLNTEFSPHELGIGSHYKAWWRCSADESHIFQQSVALRTRRKCPFCRVAPKSLSVRHPDIAAQLHPTKNGELNPRYLPPTSTKSVWWQCEKDDEHIWQERVVSRIQRKSPCPFCKGLKVSADNSLAVRHPELSREWHPHKNGQLTPETVTTHTNKKVWWLCNKQHVWLARISIRIITGSSCPFCAHKYLARENSLAVRFPEIAAQWHPTKNRNMLSKLEGSFKVETNLHLAPEDRPTKNRRLSPEDVSFSSHQMIWWQCSTSKEHVWQAAVKWRTSGTGCPFCSNRYATSETSLATRYPGMANQWHPTRNKPLSPAEVTPGSSLAVWWRCARSAKHVWKAKVADVYRSWRDESNGCPFCAGKKIISETSLAGRCPDVAKLWHPTLNAPLTPDLVSTNNSKIIYWQCPKNEEHVWQAILSNVVGASKRGRSGCPFCAGKKVSPERSLETVFPDLAKLWHCGLNESLQPHHVTFGSNKIAWWQCPKDGNHVWQKKINNQVDTWKRGLIGCPECRTA